MLYLCTPVNPVFEQQTNILTMKPFIHEDFLLTTESARRLYHDYAEKMPIIDYHCHLVPKEIAEDCHWENLAQAWLYADHYKWRQMRSNGVDEKYCTGNASDYEKFLKYAETMEVLLRNPLFDWSQLELARYFGVTERLSRQTASGIWEKTAALLAQPEYSARGLMRKSNVCVVCTTDDPVDDLHFHREISDSGFEIKVLPAWRSDKAAKVENPVSWNQWVDALAAAAAVKIDTWDDFLQAMDIRHRFFAANGCVLSDYGTTEICADDYTESEIRNIFTRLRRGESLSAKETRQFRSAWLTEGLAADARADWSAQIHYNCLRNNNTRMFCQYGPDGGFDSIGDEASAAALNHLFDRLEQQGVLPRMVVYSLNPNDMEMLGSLLGNFQHGPEPGRMQLGAAWWFNDHRQGMLRHIDVLSTLGVLGRFVGMLTDSRSFLSYTRHEYFRRILCGKLGEEMEKGILPNDLEWIGKLVQDISFNNANQYFFKH